MDLIFIVLFSDFGLVLPEEPSTSRINGNGGYCRDLDSSASLDAAARKVFFTLLPGVEGTFYNEKFVDDVLSAVRRYANY